MAFTKYFEIGRINFMNSIVYAGDLLASSLFIGLIIFIFINLWKIVYANTGVIEGFTITMMLWYFVMTESIVTAQTKVLEEIWEDVVGGNLANYLNKPYNYLIYKYASSIGRAILKFFLTFIIGGTIVLIFLGGISIKLYTIPFILIIVLLAISLNFMIMTFLGIFAFWLEDARALSFIYQKIVFTIGGMLLPLEIFPAWIMKISSVLPFSYIAYHPAKLFVEFSFQSFFQVLIFESAWIILFAVLVAILYKKSIKRLTINGG